MDSRTHKTVSPEFIKPEILKSVYTLYLNGMTTHQIMININHTNDLDFSPKDIDEIIDYLNEMYV